MYYGTRPAKFVRRSTGRADDVKYAAFRRFDVAMEGKVKGKPSAAIASKRSR
jgi:hypothetical protein